MKRKRNTDVPNQAANKSKAEGARWSSESDTVERRDRNGAAEHVIGEEGGGISNRPIGEEVENQELMPERGAARRERHDGRNRSVEEE